MFIIWISMSDVCECIFLSPCLNIAPCASNYINEGRGNKKGCKCCGGISTGGEGVLGEGGNTKIQISINTRRYKTHK